MGIPIQSGASATEATVDATSLALRSTPYNPDGSVLALVCPVSSGVTPGTTRAMPVAGADYKTPRMLRVASDGSLVAGGDRQLALHDSCEGAAVNTNKWIQTTTTMTITQAAATGILLNAGSSVAATVGAMQTSLRMFERPARSALIMRCHVRATAHFDNNLIEVGFGNPAAATTLTNNDGAVWRENATGQYVPVLSIGTTETLGTPISNATFVASVPTTDYAVFEVQIEDTRAVFRIYTNAGALVNEQTVDYTGATASFTVTRLQAMFRTYNNASGTSTAVQVFVDEISVFQSDQTWNKPWGEVKASQSDSVLASPVTTFAQLEVYANNAATGTTTPTNTAAGQAALGGTCAWNNAGTSFAASDTLDLVIFGFQIPSPYGLMVKGITLDSVSLGAANGAAIYTIQWFLYHATTVALNAGTVFRKVLGFQTIANGAAIGTQFSPTINIRYGTGFYVQPGRFVGIGARVIGASAATASQVIRTFASFDGYFE